MKIFSTLLILFTIQTCCSQTTINQELKSELEELLVSDQIYREYIDNATSDERRKEICLLTKLEPEYLRQHIFEILPKVDSANFSKIEKIISKYGYPGKTLVGEPANTTAFYIIQHNPEKIPYYYPLINKAAKKGELPFYLSAMMLDRKLVNAEKEQIYGTQVLGKTIRNKETGQDEYFVYVAPISNAKQVNKRRKKAGFDSTVEENAKRLGIAYKSYTYAEINKILN